MLKYPGRKSAERFPVTGSRRAKSGVGQAVCRDIFHRLGTCPNPYLSSNLNSKDIELLIRSETDRLNKSGSLLRFSTREGKATLRDEILERLTSDAQGMQVILYDKTTIVTKANRDGFRWANLRLKALQKLCTEQAVIERLGRLPKTFKRCTKSF